MQMLSWHTPTTIFPSTSIPMVQTTKWVPLLINLTNLFHNGSKIDQNTTKLPYYEEKLLSIVMVLETFVSMLLGAELFIYTNHKNLTFANLNCFHVLCWISYVEEYGPTILSHPGKMLVIGHTFSWLLQHKVLPIPVGENAPVVLFDFTSNRINISNDPDILKCFLNIPLPNVAENNPVDIKWLHELQNIGKDLQQKLPNTMTAISTSQSMDVPLCAMLQ